MDSGENIFVDRSEQEDEQRLREVMCKRRVVSICCHDSPHDEAVVPRLRPFHTVSPRGWVNKLLRYCRAGFRGCIFGRDSELYIERERGRLVYLSNRTLRHP